MAKFQVKVQFTVEDPNSGKIKFQNVNYLVEAESVIESEAKVTKYLRNEGEDQFEVKAVTESKISVVIP